LSKTDRVPSAHSDSRPGKLLMDRHMRLNISVKAFSANAFYLSADILKTNSGSTYQTLE
jgi:hypothetical protein